MATLPDNPDPLGEALHLLRVNGSFYCRSELTAPWGVELPPMPDSMMFHVVTRGRCYLESPGVATRELRVGDLALVPHGDGHVLTSEPGGKSTGLFDLHRELLTPRYELLEHGGGGAKTSVMCVVVTFDHPAIERLLEVLPRTLVIEAEESGQTDWIRSSINLMAAEMQTLGPGGEAVITRLADILLIQVIRIWLERDPNAQTGWLGALRDPQIGRAIASIQRDPAHPWTVALLAHEIGMSRSAFSAKFTELVGEPAMRYITRWRMQLAVSWLQDGKVRISELHRKLGYASEAAFSRAFKRCMGVPPNVVLRPQGETGRAEPNSNTALIRA
ncbi:MAG: AraC family transcriptional regulator [Planctomycetes bacterium]|nr:AraC family transcriptional regulator [Planctomycetota bacterium]MCA8944791.1 AraC family transcriptional regulator [Planctomycetota bacterium]